MNRWGFYCTEYYKKPQILIKDNLSAPPCLSTEDSQMIYLQDYIPVTFQGMLWVGTENNRLTAHLVQRSHPVAEDIFSLPLH